MAKTATLPAPPTVKDLKRMVEEALANGLTPEDLVLRLTLRDSVLVKRSPLFADQDIRFTDGVMHVLGVPTRIGQIPESSLDRASDETA
ncbi:MAG TPA: hypothetical protein VEA44_06970 [Caulobacter sp.]|nr:hypothetical protein [Caulobacter sp.]